MFGHQDKINQILRGAETIKNMNDDIEEVKSFAKHFKERAEELYAENQKLNGIILKILDARTRGQALIPNDIYESIVKHLKLDTSS